MKNDEDNFHEVVETFRPRFWWLKKRHLASFCIIATVLIAGILYLKKRCDDRHSLLVEATSRGDVESVKRLMRWGLELNRAPRPLIRIAIYKCDIEMLRFLLANGVEYRQNWNNPVSLAASASIACPDTANAMIDLLALHGAPLDRHDDVTERMDARSILRASSPVTLEHLLKRGVPAQQEVDVTSLLHTPGLRCAWRQILSHGADVNWRDSHGQTAVSAVELIFTRDRENPCYVDDVEYAKILLDNGADPNIPDKEGKTALDHAYEQEKQNKDLIALLKQHGAKSTKFEGASQAAAFRRAIQNTEDIRVYSRTLAAPGSRHGLECDFAFQGNFGTETLVSDGSWVLPLGQKRLFSASCSVPSYLHFAVLLKDRTKDIPMSLNNRSNRGDIGVQFSELARDEELVVYHSASPITDLADALKTGQAHPFRRINLVVWEGKN